MSPAEKMMKRIMKPEGIDYTQVEALDDEAKEVAVAREIHKATHGMSSDPLMQFAAVFSSLIHDVGESISDWVLLVIGFVCSGPNLIPLLYISFCPQTTLG